MGLEDELQRILRDDRLDIPVRTGAEWSLVAGARRRRQRNGMLAATGSALAAVLLVGGGIALVSRQSDQPVQPAVPPVVQSAPHPYSTTGLMSPGGEPPVPPVVQQPPGQAPELPSTTGTPTRKPLPTIAETKTSEPDPTTSEPPVTSSSEQPSTQLPATEPNSPGQ
jgi:hypothetical protein